MVITCKSVLCAQQGLKLGLLLAFAQCVSTLDPVALSLGHTYGYIFGSLVGSPQVAKAGSSLFPDIKQQPFVKWEKAETPQ